MLIDELELAYNEFEKLINEDDVNGKQIITLMLKICEIENKLINQMFYDEIITKITDDKSDELSAEISCEIGCDILSDIIEEKIDINKKTFRKIKKLKNHLNMNFCKFMLNNKNDLSTLCYLIDKYSENDNDSDYWKLKKFLNRKFVVLEEYYEKTNNK